ncbi:MAG: hypothetical protein KAZ05_01395 [Negativicutes bacterium]|nr:hypothetical protein [Negativicutes bacterium]
MLLILTAIIIALSLWHFIHGRVFFNTLMRIKEMNRRKDALTEAEKAQHSKDTMKVLGYSIFLVSFRLFFLYNVYALDPFHWPTWVMTAVTFVNLIAYEQATQSPRTPLSMGANIVYLVYGLWILSLLLK